MREQTCSTKEGLRRVCECQSFAGSAKVAAGLEGGRQPAENRGLLGNRKPEGSSESQSVAARGGEGGSSQASEVGKGLAGRERGGGRAAWITARYRQGRAERTREPMVRSSAPEASGVRGRAEGGGYPGDLSGGVGEGRPLELAERSGNSRRGRSGQPAPGRTREGGGGRAAALEESAEAVGLETAPLGPTRVSRDN